MPDHPSSLPKTMKALLFNPSTNHLSFAPSHPLPNRPSEHLLHIHTTAITHNELTWSPFVHFPNPHIPTYDISGTILTSVPSSPFHPGDEIHGRIPASREGGAAEFATILPSECALRPRGLSVEEAATVPMSALTAWQGVFERAGGRVAPLGFDGEGGVVVVGGEGNSGKRVLVLGASGGVGIFAVQFARLAGCEVVGTCSSRNEAFVRGLGVREVVDYTGMSMGEYVGGEERRKFDVILDCVGGESMREAWTAVRKGGAFVSVVPGFEEPEDRPEGVESGFFVMESRGAQLAEIGSLIEKGLVRTCVDSVWGLEEWEKAFERAGSGRARGKVVLKIGQ